MTPLSLTVTLSHLQSVFVSFLYSMARITEEKSFLSDADNSHRERQRKKVKANSKVRVRSNNRVHQWICFQQIILLINSQIDIFKMHRPILSPRRYTETRMACYNTALL